MAGLRRRNIEQKVIDLSYANLDLPKSRFKHFTYVARRNRVINFGVNHDKKTNPLNHRYGYRWLRLHSEGHAILSFPYDKRELPEYDFYNVRIYRGEVLMSRPCDFCAALLISHGIKTLFYTNSDGEFERWTA